MRDLRAIQLCTRQAWSFHGIPYKWGGDDPMAGFDCSGFVVELMKSVGLLRRGVDLTAQGLYGAFRGGTGASLVIPAEGCLVFWHSSSDAERIIHVEYCLDDSHAIGASGGGGSSLTVQDAIEQNAYIKVRPFRSRKRLHGFADPFYHHIP